MKEVWTDVKHYDGLYKVKKYGRVWSCNNNKYLAIHTKSNGYQFVQLYKNGKMRNEYLHRLVALAFIPNPNNLPQVNHKDENKLNNYVDNLEWCDCKYNNNYGTARQRSVTTKKEQGFYERKSKEWKTSENPAIKNPKVRGKNSYAKSVTCDGIIFDCIKTCAEYYGVNYSTMRCWISGADKMPQYFVDANLRYL